MTHTALDPSRTPPHINPPQDSPRVCMYVRLCVDVFVFVCTCICLCMCCACCYIVCACTCVHMCLCVHIHVLSAPAHFHSLPCREFSWHFRMPGRLQDQKSCQIRLDGSSLALHTCTVHALGRDIRTLYMEGEHTPPICMALTLNDPQIHNLLRAAKPSQLPLARYTDPGLSHTYLCPMSRAQGLAIPSLILYPATLLEFIN